MSARRSQARRAGSGQQVRSRGLLVVTLVLIGAFVSGLAYLKNNAPPPNNQTIRNQTIHNQTNLAAENPTNPIAPAQKTAPVQQAKLPTVQPKYDFYSELPKRQLVITKDDINPRPQRDTQPPPPKKENKPATKKPPQQATTAKTAKKPSSPPATRQNKQPVAVEMPKIELISRRDRNTANTSRSLSNTSANTGNNRHWMIQAGAYSIFDDADRVRARISLLGIRARVEAGVSNNRQVHRVRIGPILSKDAADSVNRRLRENNIPSLLIRSN